MINEPKKSFKKILSFTTIILICFSISFLPEFSFAQEDTSKIKLQSENKNSNSSQTKAGLKVEKEKGKEKEEKDWWDKAGIISQFFAGVVIAIIGFYLTYTIQNTQMKIAKENAQSQIKSGELQSQENRKLQQGQLTGQLVEHLTSNSEKVREIAIVALRESVPKTIYDSVIQIIANNDESQQVRETAIKQLGESKDESVSKTLGKIASDENRSESERKIASEAAGKLSTSLNIPKGTLILTATDSHEPAYEVPELNGSPFNYFLLKGLRGEADLNKNGIITGKELGHYVIQNVRNYGKINNFSYSNPVFSTYSVKSDIPIFSKSKNYKEIVGIVVGIDKVEDDKIHSLKYCASGAKDFYQTIKEFPEPTTNFTLLLNEQATRKSILETIDSITQISSPDSLFMFYFAGHSIIQPSGEVGFIAYDSEMDKYHSTVTMSSVKLALNKLKSRVKVIFLDTSYSGQFMRRTR